MLRLAKENFSAGKALERAGKLLLDDGKFVKAAKVSIQVAELAIEDGRLIDAIVAYENTYDYYLGDSSMSSNAYNSLLLGGYCAVNCDQYEKSNYDI